MEGLKNNHLSSPHAYIRMVGQDGLTTSTINSRDEPINILRFFGTSVAYGQTTAVSPDRKTYSNPLPVKFGDPYLLKTKGVHYMYVTGGCAKNDFSAYSSAGPGDLESCGAGLFHDR